MISATYSALGALTAFSRKLDATANNVANAESDGYKRTRVTIEEAAPGQVAARAEKIETPGPMVQETTPTGQEMVEKSNVELTEEIPNLMLTRRFFEANLKTVQIEGEMLGSLLDLKG